MGLPINGGHMTTREVNKYVNISGAGTTVCIIGAGYLHSLCINTTDAGTITIYDNSNASGTKIATIAASAPVGSQFLYDIEFTNGLTIVTGAASDITVSCVSKF